MNKEKIHQERLNDIRAYELSIANDKNILPADREIFSIQIEDGRAELLDETKPKRRVKRNINPDSKLNIVLEGYKDYWTYEDGIYESENTVYHQAKDNKNLLVKDWPTEAKAIVARLLHMTVDQLNAVAEKVFVADDMEPLNADIDKTHLYGYDDRRVPNLWYEFAGTKIDPNTNTRRPFYQKISGSASIAMRNAHYYFFKGHVSDFYIDTIHSGFFTHDFNVTHGGKKIIVIDAMSEMMVSLLSNPTASNDALIYHTVEGRNSLDDDVYLLGGLASRNLNAVSFKKSEVEDFLKQIRDKHNAKVLLWKSTLDNMETLSIDEIIEAKKSLNIVFENSQLLSSYRSQWSRDIYKILSGDLADETAKFKYELSSRGIPEKFPIT